MRGHADAYVQCIAPTGRLLRCVSDCSSPCCRHVAAAASSYLVPTVHRIVLLGEETYPSQNYPSLEDVITIFLAKYNTAARPVYCMAFAVAGPVNNNTCRFTNLVRTRSCDDRRAGQAGEKHGVIRCICSLVVRLCLLHSSTG